VFRRIWSLWAFITWAVKYFPGGRILHFGDRARTSSAGRYSRLDARICFSLQPGVVQIALKRERVEAVRHADPGASPCSRVLHSLWRRQQQRRLRSIFSACRRSCHCSGHGIKRYSNAIGQPESDHSMRTSRSVSTARPDSWQHELHLGLSG
jgi:hypothetical protein